MAYGELEQEALTSKMMTLSPEAARTLLEELQRLDRLELEYRAAWERSKAQHERRLLRAEAGGLELSMVIQDDACGDPRYLQGVERCIRQRCELLGLYDEGERQRRTTTARPSITADRLSWLGVYEAGLEETTDTQQGDDDDG